DAAVDAWVERLHPSVQDLREAGDLRHLQDGQARLPEEAGRPPGGDQLHPEPVELAGQLDHPGLVVNAQQRAPHLHPIVTLLPWIRSRPSANSLMASGYSRCSSARIRADSVS